MLENMIFVCQEGLRNFALGVDIFFFQKNVDGSVAVPEPISMKRYTPEEIGVSLAFPEPLLRVDRTAAQQLMDELWKVGLRPSEGTGSAGSLAATQRHLEDMRRLVFEPNDKRLYIDHPKTNWLEGQDFYERCQAYRHAPDDDQAVVTTQFEALKRFIARHSSA